MKRDLRRGYDGGKVASRRMTNLAAFLLASLGVVTAALVLLDVGTGFADANIGQVLEMLGTVTAPAAPAVLAAVAFSRRPALPAARTFAVLVALGHGALGLFGAWAGWATKDAVSGEARDAFATLQVIGGVLVLLSVATLLALRLAVGASRVGSAGEDGSDPSPRHDPSGHRELPDTSRTEQQMTSTRGTPRSPLPLWLVPFAIAAAAVGAALGVWADWTYPNPVYGVQVILLAGTSLIAAVAVLLRNIGQVGRAVAVSSVALLVGSIGGLALSPPAIIYASGTMTLRVDRPEPMIISGVALCEIHTLTDELSVQGDLGEGPPVRPGPIQVYLAAGNTVEDDPMARDDGLALTIWVENLDTNAGGPEAGATPDSTLELRRDDTAGTLRFAELHTTGGGPAWLTNPALEGTVEWSCVDE